MMIKTVSSFADVLDLLNEHGAYGPDDNYGQSYTPLSEGRGNVEFLQYLDQSLLQRLNDLRAALAFFDLTIRQDESAKQRLLDNQYEANGLTLETRNF